MKTHRLTSGRMILFLLLLSVGLWSSPGSCPFMLKGAVVYPATGPKIENATILIENGKIAAVGPDIKVPSGVEVVDVSGKVIIPGLE